MIRTGKRVILATVLLLATLAFIWGNSMTPGTESHEMSGGILQWISRLLNLSASSEEILHLLIRKAAHFCEFALLGLLLTWRVGMTGRSGANLCCPALLGGLLAACMDESIQLFIPERGPSIRDVAIDSAGVVLGITVLYTAFFFKKRFPYTNRRTK
jgi:VanZ family protein